MNKRWKCVFALLTTTLLTACAFSRFDGSRTGNESQFIMEYDMLNMTDSQKLALSEGDIVDFDVVSLSGSVDIVLSEEEEEPIYNGTDIPTSTFQVAIDKSGTYVVSVVGKKAKGSVKILKKSKDAEKENVSLPDMRENDAGSSTEEHCESVTIADHAVIGSEFDIDLTEDETTFLTLEVTEDMETVAHYSYTTREKEGAVWGYYPNGSEEKTAFELRAGTESVYDMFWTDEKIALKKGTNVFYISGDDISCKMHFELPRIDKTKVSHVGTYTKEAVQEKGEGKNIADTFGISILLPENRNWIMNRKYHLSDENNLTIAYYDSVAEADCTILVSKNEDLSLPEVEYDESLNESWEGKTAANQNIIVKVQHGKNDNKAVLATWEYREYEFAIMGEAKKSSDSIPKTALYIINNLN